MRKTLLALLAASFAGVAQADNWMGRLPDNTYAAVVSIPGAHDAATGSGWADGMDGLGDLYARTQELTLAQLWQVGVRAFDMRPCAHEGYLNLNHGIMSTQLHFDEALYLLRDSLQANPTEFVVIHMLHASDGDQTDDYTSQLLALLQSDELKDVLVDFKPQLTVGELRGKILIISRDKYATKPVGGFFLNWTGEINWSKQTMGRIQGPSVMGKCYMQDYADTHATGGVDRKVEAMKKLLDYSTTHVTNTLSSIVWVVNLASAYSLVQSLFGYDISLSDGYRDNATYTHAALIDYLANATQHGPTGIVFMDYAGVNQSGDYEVRGLEAVQAIIDNNFTYLDDVSTAIAAITATPAAPAYYSLSGHRIATPLPGQLVVEKRSDGSTRKVRF